MNSAQTDPDLRDWLRWASEGGNVPMFVRTVAEAARMACSPDYVMLRPVLLEVKRQQPGLPPGQGALDVPELAQWLPWATRGGNVPSFVGRVVEAAAYACASGYVLLRPVLIELKMRYPENLYITVAAHDEERKESVTKKAKGNDVVLTTGRRAAMKRSRKAAEAKAATTRKHRSAGVKAGPTRAPYI